MTPSPILSAAQMAACDRYTMEVLGIPSQVLMERAATKAAVYLLNRTDLFPVGKLLLLCGSGNNGGDGFAMARFLSDGSLGERRSVTVLYTGKTHENGLPDTTRMSTECRRQYGLASEIGIPILPMTALEEGLRDAAAVVDAVFGIGLDRPITGDVADLLLAVADQGLPVLAVDIPSGIKADTGEVLGVALSAAATVTMQALKPGLLLYPGAELCGEIAVAELGIDLTPVPEPYGRLADEALLRQVLPPRTRRSHKGTYGRLTLLCGSEGMSGAAVLAAKAALRSGVGLARVLTPEANRTVLQATVPEAIVSPCHTPEEATVCTDTDGLVLGCGLSTALTACACLRAVLSLFPDRGSLPTVLDADGLNLLAEDASLWETPLLSSPDRQVVITPHPAEMSRLCNKPVSVILADPVGTARDFARERGVTVVLKDAHTVIASPDGRLFLCAAGNAGMAKGGSGDVLAGVIGALLVQNRGKWGQELTVAKVAAAGVYLHAAAGDLAAHRLGEYGMLAGDLIECLPLVSRHLSDSRTVIRGI